MHYIAILYERSYQSLHSSVGTIELRGHNARTWVPPELHNVKLLPINELAFALCPTSRDTYLSRVANQRTDQTWVRYKGRVIDEIYKLTHKECREYASRTTARNFDLCNHMITKCDDILEESKKQHVGVLNGLPQQPARRDLNRFDQALKKIVLFEALITAARIDFEIARVEAANPQRIFSEYFNFNIDLTLTARHQGFRPGTPDFIYRSEVIGDIKSGTWHDYLEYTVIAYALAYEEHTTQNMDYGVILHVELPPSRPVPTYYRTDLIYLDDYKRKRFLALRDRKLQIVANKNDPGTPANKDECDPECPYLPSCWEGA